MRRAVFIVLLAAAGGGAFAALGERDAKGAAAGWIQTGGNGFCVLYSNPATIRREGDRVKIWELLDHKVMVQLADGKAHMSIKRLSEYDCAQDRWRTLNLTLHTGQMATGEVVYSSADPDDWHPVLIGSAGEALRAFACSKP